MRVFLAWHNVWASGRRLFAATAGIAFAILLMFMQLGVIDTLRRAATLVYDAMEFDIILVSNEYQYVNRCGSILSTHLAQAGVIPGVAAVVPMEYGVATWIDPATGTESQVMVLGLELDPAFVRDPMVAAGLDSVREAGRAMIDVLSDPALGPFVPERATLIRYRNITLTRPFRMGMGLYTQGAIIVSHQTFRNLVPLESSRVSFGLIRLSPGADKDAILDRLGQMLPEDVVAFDRETFLQMERDHYTWVMPLGALSRIGVAVSLLLGLVVLFQVLSTDLSNRLDEFATLRAAGFPASYIYGVGMQQSAIFAVLGYLPALGLADALFRVVQSVTRLPMFMTWRLALVVLGLAIVMCLGAGVLALRKVQRVDPADLL